MFSVREDVGDDGTRALFEVRVESVPSRRRTSTYLTEASFVSLVSDTETSEGETEVVRGRPCPFCGASMAHRHCKYVCPEHGVVYDCSDTFW
ncbi:hypothetical protein SAMN04488124_2182 [Halogeometricum limi]|uniref:Small CPxCG-related zinc finger protein n=1 Tax=Halogeometricum limi TaxID=555875 RepID=A0A1I6HFL1_9EURY|nr:hypothetical protein SAMN04488124_2182 [Halogeometricum limi]